MSGHRMDQAAGGGMDPRTSKGRFEELIASAGIPLAALTLRAGLDWMLRFYGDAPATGGLRAWWGVVTRYGDDEIGFDITRWFLDEYERVTELSLIFKIGPPATAGDFPWLMKWCSGPEDLADFRSAIEGSPAFGAWGRSRAAGVALVYEDHSTIPLFDCWGARDPSRPVVSMTEEEWLRSDDVALMLRWFRQEWRGEEADLDGRLQRYCLACCRRIWPLLPQEASRAGVEVAERFLDGRATREELGRADWLAEGAAFKFDFDTDSEAIARWCEEVARIPPEELAAMIHAPRPEDDLSPRRLLELAAYFADCAMCYPGIQPKESIERYRLFLSAPLLREVVGNPFRTAAGRSPA
jgi:hypothetical protein